MNAKKIAAAMAVLMTAGLLGVTLWMVSAVEGKRSDAASRQFAVAPYHWSSACPASDYRAVRTVPIGCADRRYRLGSVWNLGLDAHKGTQWYRLGDDAFELRCTMFDKEYCRVENAVYRKFVRGSDKPKP